MAVFTRASLMNKAYQMDVESDFYTLATYMRDISKMESSMEEAV